MSDFQRVTLVTGGARGLGLATARALAEAGCAVVIGTRDKTLGEAAALSLRKDGLQAESVVLDVINPAHRRQVVDYLAQTYGRLDSLVNNAGVWLDDAADAAVFSNTTATIAERTVRDTFEVNFFAPLLLTQALVPLLVKSTAGRIVNVSSNLASNALHSDSSSAAWNTKPFAYSASKAALNSLTTHLAHALRDTSVKVNSVHPGWVRTTMGGLDAPLEDSEGCRSSVMFA
ncbi:SDR family NAD(P)-dependent oxidoreductase, partial [Caballeronia mineralivorans]|uniref:SDR family NAD(P)-dependent oxidoreductase n=1 Tax=Caballeronia mineralivorans TaxID=2010198 RepID=UPI0023F09EC4